MVHLNKRIRVCTEIVPDSSRISSHDGMYCIQFSIYSSAVDTVRIDQYVCVCVCVCSMNIIQTYICHVGTLMRRHHKPQKLKRNPAD